MISRLTRNLILAAACAAVIATTAGAAIARTIYDGVWSVLIVTEQGSCDRAYRYGIQIDNGQVIYDGGGLINMGGRVQPNGNVKVTVQSGSSYATGSGRMSRNVGRGTWSGRSGGDACAGVWQAERRG